MIMSDRIGLGTAQWGMRYGISNKVGMASSSEVQSILYDAEGVGRIIDTAFSYGKSEQVLGAYDLEKLKYRLITKTDPLRNNNISSSDIPLKVRSDLIKSLSKLKISQLYGLMVHHASDLLGEHGQVLWNELVDLKSEGLVSKIGCSFYSPEEFFKLANKFDFDLVQIPFNIFDQRYIVSGMAEYTFLKNIEVHLRSIFLQGLLLVDSDSIIKMPTSFLEKYRCFESICIDSGYDKFTLALMFALETKFQESLIIGTELFSQWKHLKNTANRKIKLTNEIYSRLVNLKINDEKVINPSLWNQ